MPKNINCTSPGMRLKVGASVLAAARAVDTRLVETRLTTFERGMSRTLLN